MTAAEKQTEIDNFLSARGGRLSPADVQRCYQQIVNPGFVGKATHALSVCFGTDGQRYAAECFRMSPESDRLYNVRNAINHGEIDAENPTELARVASRLSRLRMINWRVFGRLLPFPAPVDTEI